MNKKFENDILWQRPTYKIYFKFKKYFFLSYCINLNLLNLPKLTIMKIMLICVFFKVFEVVRIDFSWYYNFFFFNSVLQQETFSQILYSVEYVIPFLLQLQWADG